MKVQVSENRFEKLILKVLRGMNIDNLYRVTISFTKDKETGEIKKAAVGLFFDIVRETAYFHNIQKDVLNMLESIFGIEFFVVPIPYSEAKYHLNAPRNI
jgi:hypothetical protein